MEGKEWSEYTVQKDRLGKMRFLKLSFLLSWLPKWDLEFAKEIISVK